VGVRGAAEGRGRGKVRKTRRGGRAGGTGRGGSRSVTTEPRSTSTSHHDNNDDSALAPGEIVLDSLGMHFSPTSDSPFSLGDFEPRGEQPGVESAADDGDSWRLVG